MRSTLFLTCAGAAAALSLHASRADSPPTRVIALSGTSSAPFGVPGDLFTTLSSPTISQNGVVGFTAVTGPTLDGPFTNNVFTWHNEQGALIARSGQLLADHPTLISTRFGTPVISDAGELAFWADSTHGNAMVAGSPGSLHLIALALAESPPQGNWVSGVGELNVPLFSRSGRLGFEADNQSMRRVYAGTSSGVSLAFQVGAHPPGLPSETTFNLISNSKMDDSGNVVALGELFGGGFNGDLALLSGGPDGLRTVSAPGLPAPGGGVYTDGVSPPNVNGSGVFGLREGLTIGSPAGPVRVAATVGTFDNRHVIAFENDPAPGVPNHFLASFDAPVINHSGHAALPGVAWAGPGNPTLEGIWVDSTSELTRRALAGDPVDNLPNGWTMGGLNGASNAKFLFNDRDQIAFLGTTRLNAGPLVTTLLASLPDGELLAIARRGYEFEVAPGDSRVVTDIGLFGSEVFGAIVGLGGDDGYGTALNDRGDLAFALYFTDGSSGIFVTTIPAPGPIIPLALAALVCTRRRRR
jgi:hypothetical protein